VAGAGAGGVAGGGGGPGSAVGATVPAAGGAALGAHVRLFYPAVPHHIATANSVEIRGTTTCDSASGMTACANATGPLRIDYDGKVKVPGPENRRVGRNREPAVAEPGVAEPAVAETYSIAGARQQEEARRSPQNKQRESHRESRDRGETARRRHPPSQSRGLTIKIQHEDKSASIRSAFLHLPGSAYGAARAPGPPPPSRARRPRTGPPPGPRRSGSSRPRREKGK
jgi:hypothetical protein